jgi:hypothetical protein
MKLVLAIYVSGVGPYICALGSILIVSSHSKQKFTSLWKPYESLICVWTRYVSREWGKTSKIVTSCCPCN